MKRSLLVFLLSVCAFSLNAQSHIIKGEVRDQLSGELLTGITVYLEELGLGSITNHQGEFIISDIPSGNFTIICSGLGYNAIKTPVALNSSLTKNFKLEESILNLPQVMVISGGSTRSKELPGSVSYLSPKELQKFNYTNANQILASIPGVNIESEDGFGLKPNIGLRGTGVERSSKITLMEDGILMSPAPYTAPAAYYFPTIGRMQAIEVLKGASQIKYGPFTTGGAINLISTQIPTSFAANVRGSRASYGTSNFHANLGSSFKNVAFMVETFQYGSEGFKKLDNGDPIGFDKKDYLAKLKLFSDPSKSVQHSLLLKGGYNEELSHETYLGLTQNDFDKTPLRRYGASQKDQMDAEHKQFSASYSLQTKKNFTLDATIYQNNFKRNWYKLYKVKDSINGDVKISPLLSNPSSYPTQLAVAKGELSNEHQLISVKANNREYYSEGIQIHLSQDFRTGAVSHSVSAGSRLHKDEMDRFQWVDDYRMMEGDMVLVYKGVPGTESNRIEQSRALAAWMQYDLSISKLNISPGLRFENVKSERLDFGKSDPERDGSNLKERENEVNAFMPGIGLSYVFNQNYIVFAGAHKGFAPPGNVQGTNPEESLNWELGMRSSRKALSTELVLFYNDYSNLLGSDLAASGGSGTGDLFNGGEAITKGLELSINYDVLSFSSSRYSLPISFNYTYTHAAFMSSFESNFEPWGSVSEGDLMPYLSPNQWNLSLGFRSQKLAINLSVRYRDRMRTHAGAINIDKANTTDSYTIADLNMEYFVRQNFSLSIGANNLFDAVYVSSNRPAGYRPGAPRMVVAGVNFKVR